MQLQLSSEELAFQEEVRAFLKDKFTPELEARILDRSTFRDAVVEWQKELYDQGWIAPNWPKEYGGPGWTLTQKFIFANEMALYGAPEPLPFGIKMVGPVLYAFGNDEQKEKYLPGVLQSDTWWCQGFSEPGAGSDLSSLQTKAEKKGDKYIVNGSKIWTSYAQYADWIFCLVRTSNEGKQQQGISFLLIDMNTPGVTVRPIKTIDAMHHLNEVFLENVEVPVENLVGEEGQGWTIAKFLLNNERGSVADVPTCKLLLKEIKELSKTTADGDGVLADNPFFQQKFSDAEVELMALEVLELRSLDKIIKGTDSSLDFSALKILGTELQQTLMSIRMEVLGVHSGVVNHDGDELMETGSIVRREYLYGRAATIYAGSNEVQRNIISKFKFGF